MNRPHRRKIALLIALVALLTQSQAHLAFAGLGPGGLTTGDLTYHGNAVMPNPTNYLIFWLPGGSSFEPAGSAYTDGQFEALEQQYFQDVCGTRYYNTLTPLSFDPANPTNPVVQGGPIQNACSYGGSWVDTTAYPHAGSTTDPLFDSDIQNSISRARTANPGWVAGLNEEYFVYTAYGIQECASSGGECTFQQAPGGPSYCAYHGTALGNSVVYAYVSVSGGCSVGSKSPNNPAADSAADTSSHEEFEAVSDPHPTKDSDGNLGGGWYNGDTAHENGDQCNFYFGSADANSDGTNLILNGHKYRLQWEWLNKLGTDQGGGDLGTTGCAPSYCDTDGGVEHPCDATGTLTESALPAGIAGNPGDDIAFTFNYANTSGTDGAYNTKLQVNLSPTLKYTSTSGGPAPTQSGNQLNYNIGTLGVGASGSIVVHVSPTSSLADGSTVEVNGVFTGNDQLGGVAFFPPSDATVNVVNSPPSFDPIAGQTVDYHDSLNFDVAALDVDSGDTLVMKASGLPAGLSFTDFGRGFGTVSGTVTDPPGTYPVTFTVNDGHNPDVTANANIAVTREETAIAYTGDTVIAAGANTAHLSGVLMEDGASPIAGRQVTLTVGTDPNTNSCTGVTDVTGTVSCTISAVSVPLGPQPVTATFAGDTYYLPSLGVQTATVFGFLSRGTFGLGDVSVANATSSSTLTWWGDTWQQLDALTGGPAPSPFKGFMAAPSTTPPVCGGTWTTTTGNSSAPPSSVPAYMGVAVTKKVSKSGNTLSGTITKIVVVKTNAGYSGSPGTPGTGTIVATYC